MQPIGNVDQGREPAAKGSAFLAAEDSDGVANVVVSPHGFAACGQAMRCPIVLADGVVQNDRGCYQRGGGKGDRGFIVMLPLQPSVSSCCRTQANASPGAPIRSPDRAVTAGSSMK